MLLFVLACTPNADDSGLLSPPVWSGTQIGEEGDAPCALNMEPWESDQALSPGTPTPEELRESLSLGGEGRLESTWQGGAPLSLSVDTESGGILRVSEEIGCGTNAWLAVDAHLILDAPALLSLDTWVPLRTPELLLTLDDFDGELDPGLLPNDASQLQLRLHGPLDGDGALTWLLWTQGEQEFAPAGTWTLN